MKRLQFGVLWLAGFLLAGYLAGEICKPFLVVGLHNPFWAIWPYAGELGAAAAAILFIIAAVSRLARGSRVAAHSGPRPIRFGPWQALVLLVGFSLTQLAGLGGFLLLLNGLKLVITLVNHQPPDFDTASGAADVTATLAGALTAGCWCIWYIRRRGLARLRDGSPSGIAWRAGSVRAYCIAVLFAAAIILVVVALLHFIPPDISALQDLPDSQLFSAPGWPSVALLLLAVGIAPPLEEFVFRGGIFAALATRFTPLTAGIVTTIVFVAVHAPQKIHYLPGFIDVGLMAAAAAWMRVKFHSIRPGILLHVLYNAGLLFVAGLAS
jgi:membrane protease YdiL (CAAX protease family)